MQGKVIFSINTLIQYCTGTSRDIYQVAVRLLPFSNTPAEILVDFLPYIAWTKFQKRDPPVAKLHRNS